MKHRSLWIGIAVLAGLVAVRVIIGDPQLGNIRKGRRHVPKVLSLLRTDPRFAHVDAEEFSGQGGSLGVRGYVSSAADLQDLKRLVESTAPPVKVSWLVSVLPTTTESTEATGIPATNP